MTDTNQKLSFFTILRRLIPFAKPYSRYIILSVILTIIGALAAQIEPLVLAYLVNQLTTLVQTPNPLSDGILVLIISGSLLIGKAVVLLLTNFGQGYLGENLKVKVAAALSNAVYSHLIFLGIPFFDNDANDTGRLITRIDRGVEGLSKVVKNILVDILPLFATAILSLAVMFSVNVYAGMVALIITGVYFLLSYNQARQQEGVRIGIHDLKEERTKAMVNSLVSIRVIKSFVRERFEIQKHEEQNDTLSLKEIKHHLVNKFYDALKLFSGDLGATIIVIFTSYLILRGQVLVGAILLNLTLFRNVTAPIRDLHRIYDEHNEAVTFSHGYFKLLDTQGSEKDISSEPNIAQEWKGDITFENVNFSYDAERKVLRNINMTLKRGQTTALVGLSGAGKTTIASLLCRFYEPQEGRIILGEKRINDIAISRLREQIGMVLQENHIFDGTISDNIRYGKLNATNEEIQRAAESAQLHSFVMNLPLGYETSARQLSGGQKQRVALARLFLKNPPILVLDEPTASLDAITTDQIKRALDEVRKDRTVLIISHNISQIIDADQIYVIKEGQIVEKGTHESLYAAAGHYTEIIDSNVQNLNLKKLMTAVVNKLTQVETLPIESP